MTYSMYIFILTLVIFSVGIAHADQIDNGLSEEPTIHCGGESLLINVKTNKPFEGHIYVKGHYSIKQCRSDATLDPKANLSVSYSDCNVIRQRSSNPKGLMMTATIIVSFHPMFITKIDRSYKVQCFYTEVSKTVTKQLNVDIANEQQKSIFVMVGDSEAEKSENVASGRALSQKDQSSAINYNIPLPTCHYKVLNAEKTGEVAFAKVGQIVYHEWSCKSSVDEGKSPFCATVHSCNVNDDTGKEVQIFDENGCAVDKYLINNLEYVSDLTGGQLSQVFKFADQPSVFFQCKIRLGLKNENGTCSRSSDNCPVTLRGKRSIANEHENDFDVVSQTVTVLDVNEPIKSMWKDTESELKQSNVISSLCISSATAQGIVVFILISAAAFITLLVLLCFRHRTVNLKLVD